MLHIGAYAKSDNALAKKFFDIPKAKTLSSESNLIIIDSKNNRRVRSIKRYYREVAQGSESYVEFITPADVKGTKFLTISKDGKDDEQRLYLPALGKVRRIAGSDKDASFMGTDLNYYDLEDYTIADFSYKDLGTDEVNKKAVFVLEMTPLDTDAPYSKQVFFLDKETYFPILIDCYDKKGILLKKIINLKTIPIDGVIVVQRMVVNNVQKNQKTLLDTKNISVNKTIPKNIFSIQHLTK